MAERRRCRYGPTPPGDPRVLDRGESQVHDHPRWSLALVFARHYYRDQQFAVVSRLPAATTIEVLDGPTDRGIPVVGRPDEYVGYIVEFDRLGTPVYSFLFAEELLRAGERYRLVGQVTYFDGTLNLLSTPIELVDGTGT